MAMDFERIVGEMRVAVYESNPALGQAAAEDFAAILREELRQHDETAVIFATGNSQLSFLNHFTYHEQSSFFFFSTGLVYIIF